MIPSDRGYAAGAPSPPTRGADRPGGAAEAGSLRAPAQVEHPAAATMIALPRDRTWDVHQAAAFLKRSVSWVYKAAERGEIPRARGFAWGLKFIPSELEAWRAGQIETASVVPIQRNVKRNAR